MPQSATNPARGRAAGLGINCSSRNAPRFSTPKRSLQAHRYDPRFRQQIEAIHRLGPAALACLVAEIAAGADLRATIAAYAELDPGLIAAYGADRFPAMLHAVEGKL